MTAKERVVHSSPDSFVWEQGDSEALQPTRPRGSGSFLDRYQGLAPWALLIQVFLAFGWGRSALAHALSGQWWSGSEVSEFVELETAMAIEPYRWLLDGPVSQLPALTAAVVLVAESVVAIMLGLNYRTKWAVMLGAFLNVQFIAAGAVNPSIFYLVAALAIGLGRLEAQGGPFSVRRQSQIAIGLGSVAILALIPWVTTLSPDRAIEDPALVLIFLTLLAIGGQLWVHRLTAQAVKARFGFFDEDEPDGVWLR